MFYDKSDGEFSNWWDSIDGEAASGSGEGLPDGSRSADSGFGSEMEHGAEPPTDGLTAQESSIRYESTSAERIEGGSLFPSGEASGGTPGIGYDRELVQQVWEFAEAIPGNDSALWRKDEFGNWIHRFDYGRRGSEFGWEIFDPGVGRHNQGVYAMRPMQWQSFLSHYEAIG